MEELGVDLNELRSWKVEPCHTCGGHILRTFEKGKVFPRIHPEEVTSWCVGCRGFGSPELIPDRMIKEMGWPFQVADYRDGAVIRRRRQELVDVRRHQ